MYLSEDLFKACKRAMEMIRDNVPPALANYKAGREWGFEASDVAKGLSELRKRKRRARSTTPSPAWKHRGETKSARTKITTLDTALKHCGVTGEKTYCGETNKKGGFRGGEAKEALSKELRDAGTSQMILSQ